MSNYAVVSFKNASEDRGRAARYFGCAAAAFGGSVAVAFRDRFASLAHSPEGLAKSVGKANISGEYGAIPMELTITAKAVTATYGAGRSVAAIEFPLDGDSPVLVSVYDRSEDGSGAASVLHRIQEAQLPVSLETKGRIRRVAERIAAELGY